MPPTQKSWWAPVWRGLVVDPEGKHYRRIKGALWLYLYLILHADRPTGTIRQKVPAIARAMGISPWTIRDWLRRLRRAGYITVAGTGRALVIRIQRWRVFSGGHQAPSLRGMGVPIRQARTRPWEESGSPQKSLNGAEIRRGGGGPNNSIFTKVTLRHTNGRRKFPSPPHASRPRTREELLARDLAEGLQDHRNLSRYLADARQYPESLLRQLLSEVRAVPEAKIKRSRAALFTYLLAQHATQSSQDPRH